MDAKKIRRWYVVYAKPRNEPRAQFHLENKGVEVFFPRLLILGSHSPRNGRMVPLFPNYLFVKIAIPEEYPFVAWCPGVRTIVGFNGAPAPLDEAVVTFLKQRATTEGVVETRPELPVGQPIEVMDGALAGLSGVVQNPPDSKGRVRVLVNLLKREVKVTVSAHHLERRT